MGIINDEEQRGRYENTVKNYRLLDDMFMKKFFDGRIRETELVLRILMDAPGLKVKRVTAEKEVTSLQGRSVVLDVLAETESGEVNNIEIQRRKDGASPQRARYHSSLIDANTTVSGEKIILPVTNVIFRLFTSMCG